MESGDAVGDPRAVFEARLGGLVGRRISGVDYWDVHNFSAEPVRWDHGDWHHAVMGVGLVTDAGPVAVTWTGTFDTYGVEVFHDRIEHHFFRGEEGPERVGPLAGSPWDRYLGTPVRGAAAQWERRGFGPSRRADGSVGPAYAVEVPLAVRLDFAAGAVWFVAAIPEEPDGRRAFVGGDEIMVVFSPGKMRDLGFDDAAGRGVR